jgi:hypothetical protein
MALSKEIGNFRKKLACDNILDASPRYFDTGADVAEATAYLQDG